MNRRQSLPLRLLCGLIAFSTASLSVAQDSAESKLFALFGNEIVARGDGFEIKQGTLDQSVITIRSSAAGRGNDISAEATPQLEREVLRRLINIELLMLRANEEDRAKGKQVMEERIAAITERAGSPEAMERQLKAVGLDLDRLRSKLTQEATAEAVLQRELNIEITDEQVQAYYDENPARFEQPEMVRAAHILLNTFNPQTKRELSATQKEERMRKIESLLERARKGGDFAEMAVEFSEDPRTRDKGGEYTFPRGVMVPEFEAVAFSLPIGQISDVVTTTYGYHIIKVYEKIPAKTLELDEERTEQVRKGLNGQEVEKQMGPFMDELMKEANVEILDERLKPQPEDDPVPAGE